jgi:cardiolipin synthase A/B
MLALIASVVCIAGCGTVPDSDALIHDRELYWHHFKVVSPQGPLSPSESRAIIQRLEARSGKTDILERHLAFEQAISGSPLGDGQSSEPARERRRDVPGEFSRRPGRTFPSC